MGNNITIIIIISFIVQTMCMSIVIKHNTNDQTIYMCNAFLFKVDTSHSNNRDCNATCVNSGFGMIDLSFSPAPKERLHVWPR